MKIILTFVEKFYAILPNQFQNIIISLYGWYWNKHRLGGIFEKELNHAYAREFYTNEQWINYQNTELRTLLLHAYDNVPFYKKKYQNAGLDRNILSNINLNTLNKIPYLTKDELREFGKTTLTVKNKGKGFFSYSSGSTGTPIAIFYSKNFHQKWYAIYEARVRNWAGVSHKMARGMIGGRKILPNSILKPPFFRYNYVEKQTYFSAYHITPKTVNNYLKGIIDNKVEFMTGYAMSNFFLADLFNKNKLKVPKLKAVLTSSEKLTKEMRKTIEEVYKCKVFDSYSGSEACGLISENQMGELLVSPDVGVMEFIKEDNTNAQNGEYGEIISTGFLNYDQPLIRYKIGDIALLAIEQNNKSGHSMIKIEEIIGRVEDVIQARDGRKMVRFHSLFLEIDGLLLSQIIQYDFDNIQFNLVCDSTYNKLKGEKTIEDRLFNQLGQTKVYFKYLQEIPVGPNGKIKSVISRINKSK